MLKTARSTCKDD